MLYCEKCRSVCPDSTPKCPNCKNSRLRVAEGEDMVLLHRADQYTAQRLAEQFDAAGIVYELKPFASRTSSYLYDSEIMPTDKKIFVRYSDLRAAEEFSARMKKELEQEQEQAGDDEFEELPRKKRILVQVLSLLAFFTLIILAVLGADALGGWLRSLIS